MIKNSVVLKNMTTSTINAGTAITIKVAYRENGTLLDTNDKALFHPIIYLSRVSPIKGAFDNLKRTRAKVKRTAKTPRQVNNLCCSNNKIAFLQNKAILQ